METSWHGVFDMDPNDVIQVRAGDLQEFLRQQMMGVTNPGLTVATADERKDNLSELAQRLRDCKHREFNDGMDVEYAIEEAIGYNGGSIEGLFDRLADLVESSEATQPERDGETFCEIRWMRDDILEAVNRASGTSLTRDGGRAGEVEAIIDSVIGEVQKQLHDGSIEEGWGIIDSLMPEEAVERALELDPPPAPGKEAVRDWYENNYGVSELSARMNPDLTFEEALRAVPLGERFYDKLWVRDPGVRKTVFQELADRYGVSYIDVNDAWTNMRPVPGTGLLEPAYGPGIYDELNEQGAKSHTRSRVFGTGTCEPTQMTSLGNGLPRRSPSLTRCGPSRTAVASTTLWASATPSCASASSRSLPPAPVSTTTTSTSTGSAGRHGPRHRTRQGASP